MLDDIIRRVAVETVTKNQYEGCDDIDEITPNQLIYTVAFNDGVLTLMGELLQEIKEEPKPLGPS